MFPFLTESEIKAVVVAAVREEFQQERRSRATLDQERAANLERRLAELERRIAENAERIEGR